MQLFIASQRYAQANDYATAKGKKLFKHVGTPERLFGHKPGTLIVLGSVDQRILQEAKVRGWTIKAGS